jgi:hypothetical protein
MDEEWKTSGSRYRDENVAEGRALACVDAPNIKLSLERGVAITRRGRARYPRQTVFLDGAFAGPPFLDNAKRHYSLDHHEGCVRAFTLATCEQAATMVFNRLPLNEGSWRIVVNGLDLDSLLASWILMNHAELNRDGRRLLASAMPLVRSEGLIDSLGLEAGLLSGLPEELRAREEAVLRELLPLLRLPSGGPKAQEEEAARSVLSRLDGLLLPSEYLGELAAFREIGRVSMAQGKLALLCRSAVGIYEAEAFHRSRYGDQLGLLIVDKGDRHYSLRLASCFFGGEVEELYKRLNKIDPAVFKNRDTENRWGGSSDIGGSPRLTGTELPQERILEAVSEVFGERQPILRRLFGR